METLKIGLTYTGTDAKHNNYVNWLQAAGNVAVTSLVAGKITADEISKLDGIVLSGGIDVHPELYHNENINYPNAPAEFHPERDQFEKMVFDLSQEGAIPVLGICRGLQLINCIVGGTLVQDLGETANSQHRFDKTDKKHDIQIEKGSLLNAIVGEEEVAVNSAHHQAIDRLGKGLKISARSGDGVIEGIEWENKSGKSFLLAVQWHPERMEHVGLQDSPASIKIRDHFINEIKQFRKS
ncbi:MAG: gamma-glutamyl-gamma-aminobutyrate hydrolase family protein [Bacteroidota bacterium]